MQMNPSGHLICIIFDKNVKINWISIAGGDWGDKHEIDSGRYLPLSTPTDEGWVAVVVL